MSTFFNGNIENQSDNINSYFTVDSNGVLQFQAALNVPTSITCDTINANTQNIINTNNENVTGYVHATADVISNYGSNPSYSLNDIGAQMATLASDTTAISILQTDVLNLQTSSSNLDTKTQNIISAITGTTNFKGAWIGTTGSTLSASRVFTPYFSMGGSNTTGQQVLINTTADYINNSGQSKVSINPNGSVYSINADTMYLNGLNVNGYLIGNGGFRGVTSGSAFTFENYNGSTLSTIDQNGNLNINSLTITGTGTSILLNRSDAQIDYQGNASLGQITGTLIRSTNDVISNYGSNNYSLNATASGLGTANSQISILNNQVNTLNNEYIT